MPRSTSTLTSAPILVSRILALCPVVRSRNLCAALLLPLALFALLTAPATHAQAVSGNVAVVSVISTFAGNGTAGYLGDGGPASSAELHLPFGVALDNAGNVYITDTSNQRIRMVAATTGTIFGQSVTAGDIYTVAGNGTQGYNGDNIPATNAELAIPQGVVVDSAGNLYIADNGNQRIRKVSASTGIITTVVGNGAQGYNGDNILATNAKLNLPLGLALDSAGNLYIADSGNERIRMVAATTGTMFGGTLSTTAGDIYTVAGTGTAGYNGDNVLATNAELYAPYDVAIIGAGNLYIADQGNSRIRMVTTGSGIISTVAGTGTAGYNGDNIPATSAMLDYPYGVAVDSTGNLYIADQGNNRIRMVTAGSGIISTVAGDGTPGYTGNGGAATIAELNTPLGVAVDSAGNLYIADYSNNVIRKVSVNSTFPATSVGKTSVSQNIFVELTAASAITSITVPKAQNGVQEFTVGAVTGCVTDGTSVNAVDTVCTVPITFSPQYPGQRTGELMVNNGSTLVGTVGLVGIGTGPLDVFLPGEQTVVATGLNDPDGVAVDAAGNTYIVDTLNNRVVKVTPSGTQTTVGTGLSSPDDVAVDAAGNVYISEPAYGHILKVTPEGTQTTVPVSGLNVPDGVAVDGAGDLYIVDSGNNDVVEVTPSGTQTTVPASGLYQPNDVAVDAARNVYITEPGRVLKVTPSGTQTMVSIGLSPDDVAVDTAGDVYITDTYNHQVVEVTPSGIQTTVGTTGSHVNFVGVAVDGAGDIYITDPGNNLAAKITRTQQWAAVNFGPHTYLVGTTSPQQMVTLQNIGNAPLIFAPPLDTTTTGQTISSFNLNGSGTTCTDTTTLNPSAICGLGVEFEPLIAGPLTGTVNITDNNLNAVAPNNVQSVILNGIGTATPTVLPSYTLTVVPPAPTALTIVAGQTGNTTLTITPTGGYANTLTLNCLNLPSSAYCVFPNGAQSTTVTLDGSNTVVTVPLNIETNAATAPPLARMQAMPSPFGPQSPSSPVSPILPALAFWWPGSMAGLAAFGRRKNLSKTRQRMLQLCLLVLLTGALAAGVSGCHGGFFGPTPAAISNVTVQSVPASGGMTQTVHLNLTVTQ